MMSQTKSESSNVPSTQVETSVPAWVYPYRVGVIGGALGGLTMVIPAAIYGVVSGHGIWYPVNLIGATLVRDLQGASVETLSAFNPAALAAGLLLHAIMSIGLGLIFALLLPTMPGPPIIWSLTVGPLLWILASLLTLPLVNPTMEKHVDTPSFLVGHLVYGLILGWYVARQPKIHVE